MSRVSGSSAPSINSRCQRLCGDFRGAIKMRKIRCPNPGCGAVTSISDQNVPSSVVCAGCGKPLKVSQRPASPSKPHPDGETLLPSDDSQVILHASGTASKAISAAVPLAIARFEILGKLGTGGFGTVYRALDPKLGRDVAIKVLQPGLLQDADVRERFLREARTAAMLRHPHIVPVYDAGQDGDCLYIATAFIEGQTLARRISEKPLQPAAAAKIVRRLAEALHYAHSEGIIHRDIKPANAMIDPRGEPHLLDFGVARSEQTAERLTRDGSLLGTPAYMSPEQAQGKDLTAASDQYSLGATLYELLTGEAPFSGPPAVVIFNILNHPPLSPRTIDPKIPKDLETICLKAMSFEPDKRYVDCQAFAEDLRRFLSDEPILARNRSRLERFVRWCQREPVVFGLSVAVAVVALIGFGATLMSLADARSARDIADQRARDANDAKDAAIQSAALTRQREQELKSQNQRLEQTLQELQNTRSELTATRQSSQEKLTSEEEKRRKVELDVATDRQRLKEVTSEVQEMKERFPVQVYGRELESAQTAIQQRDWNRGKAILDKLDPKLRGLEWSYLRAAADQSIIVTDSTLWRKEFPDNNSVRSSMLAARNVIDDSYVLINDVAVRLSDGVATSLDVPKGRMILSLSPDGDFVATYPKTVNGYGTIVVSPIPALFSQSRITVPSVGTRMPADLLDGRQSVVTSSGQMMFLTHELDLRSSNGKAVSVMCERAKLFPRFDEKEEERSRRRNLLKYGMRKGPGRKIIAYVISDIQFHLASFDEVGLVSGTSCHPLISSDFRDRSRTEVVMTISHQKLNLADVWPLRAEINDITLGLEPFLPGGKIPQMHLFESSPAALALLDREKDRQLRFQGDTCELWTTDPPLRQLATLSLGRLTLGTDPIGTAVNEFVSALGFTIDPIWVGWDEEQGLLRVVSKAVQYQSVPKKTIEVQILSRVIDLSKAMPAKPVP
jgi:serine/threonine protein kinase